MDFEIIAILFLFALPPMIGLALGALAPRVNRWVGAVIAALPPFLGVLWIALLAYQATPWEKMDTCEPPECGFGSIWFYVLSVLSVPIFAIGFALGVAGHAVGLWLRKRRQ